MAVPTYRNRDEGVNAESLRAPDHQIARSSDHQIANLKSAVVSLADAETLEDVTEQVFAGSLTSDLFERRGGVLQIREKKFF